MEEKKSFSHSLKSMRFSLGIFVIVLAFGIIFVMIHTQEKISLLTVETINELIKINATDEKITVVTAAFEDINTSNQTFFNVLLAILAAWGGAVIAFYFGAKNLEQAQQTLKEVVTAKQQLSKTTIEDLLEELDEAADVIWVTMEDKIKDVRKKLQDSTNVLVVDAKDEKPLGVLYRWDLAKYAKVDIYADHTTDENEIKKKKSNAEKLKTDAKAAKKEADEDDGNEDKKTKAENAKKKADKAADEVKIADEKLNEKKGNDDKKLHEVIELIESEFITKKAWKTDGIKNFAVLDLKLNLLQAKEKMEKLAESEKMLLSVRGFVIDPSKSKIKAIKAIINFANLTRGLV